jgi:hypothetical protein
MSWPYRSTPRAFDPTRWLQGRGAVKCDVQRTTVETARC